MIKRLGAFSVLTIVALAAAGAVPAAADQRISIDGAKRAVRAVLHADFEPGIEKGSLSIGSCARDGVAVRCRVELDDSRGRAWCGRGSAWPDRDGDVVRTVTRFNLHRTGCGS